MRACWCCTRASECRVYVRQRSYTEMVVTCCWLCTSTVMSIAHSSSITPCVSRMSVWNEHVNASYERMSSRDTTGHSHSATLTPTHYSLLCHASSRIRENHMNNCLKYIIIRKRTSENKYAKHTEDQLFTSYRTLAASKDLNICTPSRYSRHIMRKDQAGWSNKT